MTWRDSRSIDSFTFPDYVTPLEFQNLGCRDWHHRSRRAPHRDSDPSQFPNQNWASDFPLSIWVLVWATHSSANLTFSITIIIIFTRKMRLNQPFYVIAGIIASLRGNLPHTSICQSFCRCYLVHLECNAIPQSIVDGEAHHFTWRRKMFVLSMARATTFWLMALLGYPEVAHNSFIHVPTATVQGWAKELALS